MLSLWLAPAALALVVTLTGCASKPSREERDKAVAEARQVYQQVKASGRDLSAGPCIAEQLSGSPDWSVDIAHDPRTDADNQPANQCRAYRDGKTHHFVELDPDGNLIRAQ